MRGALLAGGFDDRSGHAALCRRRLRSDDSYNVLIIDLKTHRRCCIRRKGIEFIEDSHTHEGHVEILVLIQYDTERFLAGLCAISTICRRKTAALAVARLHIQVKLLSGRKLPDRDNFAVLYRLIFPDHGLAAPVPDVFAEQLHAVLVAHVITDHAPAHPHQVGQRKSRDSVLRGRVERLVQELLLAAGKALLRLEKTSYRIVHKQRSVRQRRKRARREFGHEIIVLV